MNPGPPPQSLSGKFWKDVDTWRSLEGVVPSGSQSEAGWGWNINRAPAIAPWPPIRPSCTGHHQEGDQGHPGSIMNITANSIIKPARCLPCRLARRSYQLHLKRLLCGESVRAPGEVEDMLAQFHLRFIFQVCCYARFRWSKDKHKTWLQHFSGLWLPRAWLPSFEES